MSQRESAPRPTPTRISKAGPPRAPGRPWGLGRPHTGTRGAIDTLWMASAGPWGLPAPKTGTQGGNVSQRESAPRPTPTRISKAGPKGSGSGSQGGNVSQRESAPRPTPTRISKAGPPRAPGRPWGLCRPHTGSQGASDTLWQAWGMRQWQSGSQGESATTSAQHRQNSSPTRAQAVPDCVAAQIKQQQDPTGQSQIKQCRSEQTMDLTASHKAGREILHSCKSPTLHDFSPKDSREFQ